MACALCGHLSGNSLHQRLARLTQLMGSSYCTLCIPWFPSPLSPLSPEHVHADGGCQRAYTFMQDPDHDEPDVHPSPSAALATPSSRARQLQLRRPSARVLRQRSAEALVRTPTGTIAALEPAPMLVEPSQKLRIMMAVKAGISRGTPSSK